MSGFERCIVETTPKLGGFTEKLDREKLKDGSVVKSEACQQISSDRSDWTAQKKLLEICLGPGPSDKEAVTLNFLSRLSAQSVNNENALKTVPHHSSEHWQDLSTYRCADHWPSPSLPEIAEVEPIIDHNVEANFSRARDVAVTEAKTIPTINRKQNLGGYDKSSSYASQAGLAVLAAATARFEAFESIVDILRAAYSSSEGRMKSNVESAAAIRRRDRIRTKKFESSSFCLNPKSKKIRR